MGKEVSTHVRDEKCIQNFGPVVGSCEHDSEALG
jgi:hypothetical protein